MNKPGKIGLKVKKVVRKDTRFTFNLPIGMKELLYAEAAIKGTTPSQICFWLIEKHQAALTTKEKDSLSQWITANRIDDQ